MDFSRVEKVDTLNISSRSRTQLSQPPLLAGIPEERGRKDVNSEDHGRRRKGRKPAGILFPEETITEEPNTQPDVIAQKLMNGKPVIIVKEVIFYLHQN